MNLTPTQDGRVWETQWFVRAEFPLMEFKVFYAKVDDFLTYRVARRGVSTDSISLAPNKVVSVMLTDKDGLEDTSRDCLNELVKYLDTPVRS